MIIFKKLILSFLASVECSRSLLGRLGSGIISSYNFPFDYRHNLSCVYRFYLNIPSDGSRILCFTFNRFSLENSTPFCSFDYLEFGANPSIKFCGSGLWQYGTADKSNPNSNVWSREFCCMCNVLSFLFRCT